MVINNHFLYQTNDKKSAREALSPSHTRKTSLSDEDFPTKSQLDTTSRRQSISKKITSLKLSTFRSLGYIIKTQFFATSVPERKKKNGQVTEALARVAAGLYIDFAANPRGE
jgi:hypothetical protein